MANVWYDNTNQKFFFFSFSSKQPNDTFYEYCGYYVCGEDWEDPDRKTAYSILVAALQYGVPLMVLVFTYTSIAIVVWGKQPPGEAENQRDKRMAKSKRKVSVLFLTLEFNLFCLLDISPTLLNFVYLFKLSIVYNNIMYKYNDY